MVNGSGGFGRVEFRADDPTLTARAGLELSGELVRRLALVDRIDEAVEAVRWLGPVKQRRRGLGVGELVVSVAESILCGAEPESTVRVRGWGWWRDLTGGGVVFGAGDVEVAV